MSKSSVKDKSYQWRQRLIEAFENLDLDQDGVLTESELDLSVLNPALDSNLAAIVALLKSEFDIIQTLNESSSTDSKPGLTHSQLDALATVLNENIKNLETNEGHLQSRNRKLPKGVIDRSRLAGAARALVEEVQELKGSNPRLYKDEEDPLPSINCDAIRQGIVGNCVFLSALASVARSHPGIILKMIEDNGDNTFTVTFPGARKEPLVVNRPTIIELALFTRLTEWGFWPAVLEKAFGVWNQQMAFEQKVILAENTGCPEYWIEIFRLLTGQSGAIERLNESTIEKLTTILTEAFREQRVVTAWSLDSHTGTTFFQGIPSNHAYSVIGWDPKSSKITLRNPWGPVRGSEPETDDGRPLDGCLDGVFTMDLDHFWSNFMAIHYEKWSLSDPYAFNGDTADDTECVPIFESQNVSQQSSMIGYDRSKLGIFARISFALVLFATGILLSYPPIYCLSFAYESGHWPTVNGKIVALDKSIENERAQNSVSELKVLYSYDVLNSNYRSSTIGGMVEVFTDAADVSRINAKYPIGKIVDVHYNPNNPTESCLETGFDWFKTAGLLLWLISTLLLAVCGIVSGLDRNYFTNLALAERARRQRLLHP